MTKPDTSQKRVHKIHVAKFCEKYIWLNFLHPPALGYILQSFRLVTEYYVNKFNYSLELAAMAGSRRCEWETLEPQLEQSSS